MRIAVRVFLSWSGKRSKVAAEKFHQWLPDVIQDVIPFMSKTDIRAGARWSSEIAGQLQDSDFGILFLTKANQERPWIMFEAGALSKTVGSARVVPYLLDLSESDIPTGPLGQFQAKEANEHGTLDLLLSVNAALGDRALDQTRLRRVFERDWSGLHQVLRNLPTDEVVASAPRDTGDVLADLLAEVRSISRRLPTDTREDGELARDTGGYFRQDKLRELIELATIDSRLTEAGYEGFAGKHAASHVELWGRAGDLVIKARVDNERWPGLTGVVFRDLVEQLLTAAPNRPVPPPPTSS